MIRAVRARAAGGALSALIALALAACGSAGTPAPATVATRTTAPTATRPAAPRQPGTAPAPVLMYHVIAAAPAGAPYPGLYVPPAEFREQMDALARAGWHAVTLEELRAYWTRGTPLPAGKPVVITFDNGYQSQYTQALPVLRSLGWVGVENLQLLGLPPSQGGFGAGEVEGLLHAGWELNTQGMTHAELTTLDAAELSYQVATARRILQRRYHVAVNWFCYPSGHYDAAVVDAVRAAGFVGSTTVIPGWAHRGEDAYRMHRLRVLGGTSGAGLLELIDDNRSSPPAPAAYGPA